MITFQKCDTESRVTEFLDQLEKEGYNLFTSVISITATRWRQFIVFYKVKSKDHNL